MLSKLSSNILQNRNSVTDRLYHKSSISRILNKGKQKYFVLFTWWPVEFLQTFAFIFFFLNSDFDFWAKIRLVRKSWVHKEKAVLNSLKSFVTLYKHQS